MEWWLVLLFLFSSLILLMMFGLPVAFVFLLINVAGAFIYWGGEMGVRQLSLSIFQSITTFSLLPLPLFILMGEVVVHSGIAPNIFEALDKWFGRLPGRLSLLSVGTGTILSVLTADNLASIAIMGPLLVPEMRKRGYKSPMIFGPILGSGCLAWMIPPSSLGIILGSIAMISIGKLLMAIILPGLLLAVIFAAYVIIRCWLQPSIAPPYEVASTPLSEKLIATAKYILPIGFVIFLVTGVILLGIASPSEAAATGALGTFILAAGYRKLSWEVVRKSILDAVSISVMIFMIIAGASAFSQVLVFSGVTEGLGKLVTGLSLPPMAIFIAIQLVLVFLGMFMEVIGIMMITIPLFMPIISALGFDPVWFGVVFLLNVGLAGITPPFGLGLFVMKASTPSGTTIAEVMRAGLPFLGLIAIAMALVIAFPEIALWLPNLISR